MISLTDKVNEFSDGCDERQDQNLKECFNITFDCGLFYICEAAICRYAGKAGDTGEVKKAVK